MTLIRLRPIAAILALLSGLALGAFSAPAQAQSIKAVVNGNPVTSLEVQHRRALVRLTQRTNPSEREVLDQLIDELLVREEAQRRRISVSEADVDSRYSGIARNVQLSVPQLNQVLGQQGTSERSFKQLIRAQLLYSQVLRSRFDISRAVSEFDISRQLSQRRDNAPASYRYTVRQVIFVLPRGAGNADIQRRRQEANAMRGRVKSCDSAVEMARNLRNVAVRDPAVRVTDQLDDELNAVLAKLPIGSATTPERGDNGIEMLVLCNREQTKDNSALRQQIQFELADEQFKAEGKKLLSDLRQKAVIEYR